MLTVVDFGPRHARSGVQTISPILERLISAYRAVHRTERPPVLWPLLPYSLPRPFVCTAQALLSFVDDVHGVPRHDVRQGTYIFS